MHYEKLNTDQQKQMLDQRVLQYEQEHFNHSINLRLLESSSNSDEGTERAKEEARKAMETLEEAIAHTQTERDAL